MSLDEIKIILENRLRNLQETRVLAMVSGSLLQIASIDDDITSTQTSLNQINDILNQRYAVIIGNY